MCTIDLSTKPSQTESSVFYWGAFFGVLFFVPKDIAEHFLTQKKILSNAKTWGDLFDGDRELYEDLKERIEERIDRYTCCDWLREFVLTHVIEGACVNSRQPGIGACGR